jgi:sugar O-acyltransferase (sialic acid O-acetyltransferase NeuD family)
MEKKKKLVIFGKDMIAKLAHFYFTRDSEYEVVAFTVDQKYIDGDSYLDLPLVPFEKMETLYPAIEFSLFVAIGTSKMNDNREAKFLEVKNKGYKLASYISPRAVYDSKVGENCIVGDMTVIQPFATIGDNNFIWEQCFIACDSVVGNNCSFSSKSVVSTYAIIGNNSILGSGAIIKTRVLIAEKSLIGAASYIAINTKESGVYGEKNSKFAGAISHKIDISM